MHRDDTGSFPKVAEPVTTTAIKLRASESERRLILKVTVEVNANQSATILVYEGDSARELAARFCQDHVLVDTLVDPLRCHILDNLSRIGAREMDGVVRLPPKVAKPQGKNCTHCGNTLLPDVNFCRRCGCQREAAKPTPRHPAAGSQTPRRNQGTPRQGQASGRSTPRTGRGTPRQSGVSCPSSKDALTPPRFMKLHQDSLQKNIRLQRLRQQAEHEDEERSQCTMHFAPGTTRYAAWHRRPEDEGGLGVRLYNDAAQRQLKIKHLQAQQEYERRLQEDQETTFKPAIEASQRFCQGTSKSVQDPEGLKKRMKMERLRDMRDQAEVEGCTFKPEIDRRSDELITQRMDRLKISGTLYESLYEDALRRKERQHEVQKTLPPGVTFHPDLGVDQHRPANDETREDFLNRLAYSKSYSERWIAMKRQAFDDGHQESRSHPEFHPQTGRGPLKERNATGMPIGEYLYESGREKATESQALREQVQKSASPQHTPRMGETSRQLFEEAKRRKYRLLFDSLVANDPQGQMQASSICLDGLDDELTDFLEPLIVYLAETEKRLEFGAFCVALDYQRQHAGGPTAHLFISARRKAENEKGLSDSVPRIDPNSTRIASRTRGRSVSLHDRLYRERDIRDARLEERRLLSEEMALEGCTFRPNISPPPVLRSRSVGSLHSRGGPAPSPAASSPMLTPRRAISTACISPLCSSPAAESGMPAAAGEACCPTCGNVYAADSLFCRKCGVKRQFQASRGLGAAGPSAGIVPPLPAGGYPFEGGVARPPSLT